MRDCPATVLERLFVPSTDAHGLSAWAQAPHAHPEAGAARQPPGAGRPAPEPPVPELVRAVTEFGHRIGDAGALLVSGLPVPRHLPPTPGRPYTDIRRPVGTEPLIRWVAETLGVLCSFTDWHGGDQVQNLYPLRNLAEGQSAGNSVLLEMHTETAFRPDTPDALVLLCLREDPEALTFVCDLDDVCARLSPEDVAALRDHAFWFRRDDGSGTPPLPVLGRWKGRRRFHYADALCAGDGRHGEALEALRTAIHDTMYRVSLRSGDLLILDNTHMVHGRSPYRPRFDGTDRWLQRCLVHARPTEA